MQFASRTNKVTDSPTLAISAKAKALKAEGIDVISFSAGQPDFPTPEHIKRAGIAAIENNVTGYTASSGTPALRKAIAEWMSAQTGVDYSPKQVMVSTGAKFSLAVAIMATIEPGDEVILPAPYWVSYPDMIRLSGGEPVIAKTTAAGGYKITPDQLDNSITPKTRMLLLNSPSNPTGAVYTREEITALAGVLEKYPDIWIMSDEIYCRLIFGDIEHFSIAAVSDEMAKRTIVVNGVSKTYAMTGWRIGWMAGQEELVARAGKIQSHTTSCPCSISQEAALSAVIQPDGFLDDMREAYRRRRDLFVGLLADIDGIEPYIPDGAFYLFCDIGGLIGSARPDGGEISSCMDFADFLLDEARVATVPGGAFGSEGYVRFSFATNDEDIKRGVARIKESVAKLR